MKVTLKQKTKRKRKRKKAITPKELGLVPGVKLSPEFANDKNCFKTVSDYVIGYYIAGDGYRSRVRIAPIYRAEIFVREGKVNAMYSTHEVGEYLNPYPKSDEPPDHYGDALALIANQALNALHAHAARRKRS